MLLVTVMFLLGFVLGSLAESFIDRTNTMNKVIQVYSRDQTRCVTFKLGDAHDVVERLLNDLSKENRRYSRV